MNNSNEFSSHSATKKLNILLADDDKDDCFLFNEALEELPLSTHLISVNNGDQLMHLLQKESNILPDILFLDLNMPRKNGFQCLEEIKRNEKLKSLPVVIYSTSFDESIAQLLYKNGAHYYIEKPTDFSLLKKVIHQALTLIFHDEVSRITQPPREEFVIGHLKQAHY